MRLDLMHRIIARGSTLMTKVCTPTSGSWSTVQPQSVHNSLPRYLGLMSCKNNHEFAKPTVHHGPIATKMYGMNQGKNHFMSNSSRNFLASLLAPPHLNLTSQLTRVPSPLVEPSRNVVKYSLRKGRRKTVNAVKKRFLRLDWGGWISALPGRARHLWKYSIQRRTFLKNHVFRDARECKLLDKMVTKYWVKKKYFVDDPYENYHTRDNFYITKGVKGVLSTNLHPRPKQYTNRRSTKT